jgi:hypothetical protein
MHVCNGVADGGLHVMALLQGTKKLFGPLLDDLDCVSAVIEATELQVEACMLWRCFNGPRSCSAPC